jgi:flagellar motor switch/type III secretory pathway protein FliN
VSDGVSDPLLSPDETQALLSAMQSSGAGSADGGVLAPDRPLRDALVRADRAAAALARRLRRTVARLLGAPVAGEAIPAEIVPLGVLRAVADEGGWIDARQDAGRPAWLSIGPEGVRAIIDRRFGAPFGGAGAPAAATGLASGALAAIAGPLAADASAAWEEAGGSALALDAPDAAAAPLLDLEPVLRVACRLSPLGLPAFEASLGVSAALVSAGRPAQAARPAHRPSVARIATRIERAEVHIRAELGTADSTVRRVLALAPGDVVRLDRSPDDPVDVRVEGVVKLRGHPVVARGNIAVEITERCTEGTR